jgi:hypothetical protein
LDFELCEIDEFLGFWTYGLGIEIDEFVVVVDDVLDDLVHDDVLMMKKVEEERDWWWIHDEITFILIFRRRE